MVVLDTRKLKLVDGVLFPEEEVKDAKKADKKEEKKE